MKVVFGASDNIYKIFKTLKKIPAHKQVFIFIDEQNSFFQHARWWLQLKDLLKELQLKAICISTSKSQQAYFQEVWLSQKFEPKSWTTRIDTIRQFFFSTRSIHQKLLFKKNFVSHLIILSELAVLWLVLYLFWWMISPNASITLKPSFQVEPIVYSFHYYPSTLDPSEVPESHISVPYTIGKLPYELEMTIDVENIQVFIEDAQWRVQFQNTLPDDISLIGNTTLVTDDGLVYRTNQPISIPWWSEETPGIAYAWVTADPYQENWLAIWERGNIPKDTTLWIKNLPESMSEKRIFAVSAWSFQWWATITTWTVLLEDIERIEALMVNQMEDNKRLYLKEHFDTKKWAIISFSDLIRLEIEEFITTSSVWESATFVDWKISANVRYSYIYRDDLLDWIDTYLSQRPNEWMRLYNYDTSSLIFYELRPTLATWHYLIPTKINIVKWYDFQKDINNLAQEVISSVVWLSKEEARKTILEHSEILDATISLSPPRYDTLPSVASRVSLSTSNK